MPWLSVLFADVLALPSIETGTGRLPPIVVQTIPARLPVSYICEYLYSSRSKILWRLPHVVSSNPRLLMVVSALPL
jgi:hypothetical protein